MMKIKGLLGERISASCHRLADGFDQGRLVRTSDTVGCFAVQVGALSAVQRGIG